MRELYTVIKPYANTLAFIVGFAWDNVMLTSIDHALSNIILSGYLIISAICIVVVNMPEALGIRRKLKEQYVSWLPLVIQFSFGSLCSAYIIFYFRSAAFVANWPFLLFLILLVVGNEIFHAKYAHLTFQLTVFFIMLFSYTLFLIPVVLGNIGVNIFLVSGLVSLIIMGLFAYVLWRIAPQRLQESGITLFLSLLSVYIFFNIAYFTNTIPPVPLSLKQIGVYHSVLKSTDETYLLRFEPAPWYSLFEATSREFHRRPNEPVYVFSAIFAPERLSLPIFHRWSRFDENKNAWQTTDVLQFPLLGGRDDGYRGYSMKTSPSDGLWRVDVETLRGELIGRVEFEIVSTTTPVFDLATERY